MSDYVASDSTLKRHYEQHLRTGGNRLSGTLAASLAANPIGSAGAASQPSIPQTGSAAHTGAGTSPAPERDSSGKRTAVILAVVAVVAIVLFLLLRG